MEYFTIKRQLFLAPSVDIVKEYEKIDKFMELLEKSGVEKFISNVKFENKKCKGRGGYNPYNLFASILYCFAFFKASLRDIEDKCTFDIRVIYIMSGDVPDYSTICNFINTYILPYQYEIFTTITKQIALELNLNLDDEHLDGTKFEANSNKYKFVWKPTKYHKRLNEKIIVFLKDIEYSIELKDEQYIKSIDFYAILKDYAINNDIDINNIPSGRGVRYTDSQRKYKEGYKYLLKLLEYEEKEEICGENRNSYFKTDYDATAMVLKEDYYSRLSHDFHAGYNVQLMVSSLLVTMYGIFQDRSDHYTLIPMCDKFYKYYTCYPKNLSADSGYGIYKNYKYMKKNNIGIYVKFQAWKGESSGKKPQLFRINDNNEIICLNSNIGKELNTNTHPKMEDGKFYKWEGCNKCNYSYKCKSYMKTESKQENFRIKEISIGYELLKEEARKNLLSPKGIEIRVNRSIQIEGAFGQLKQNMNYERLRRRGLEKVSCEIMLTCLGINIRRYFYSMDKETFKENCWNTPNDLQSEIFPSVKQKEKKV